MGADTDAAPAPGVERFAIHDRSELGLVRWIGRILSLAALWPLSYTWIGGLGFDAGALLAGVGGLGLGLGLWWWAGFRLRNPREYLEIDGEAGRARLRRDGHEDQLRPVAELGPGAGAWRFEQWTTTSTSQGQRRTITWHAARCQAFPDQRLFATTDERRLRAWIAAVDAATEVAAGAEPGPRTTTVAALLAARLDALTWALAGRASLPLSALTVALAAATWAVLEPTTGAAANPPAAIVVGLAGAGLALGWRAARGPWVGATVAALFGAALVAKPWVAPITSRFDGSSTPLSPTSETHLYFVIPGLLLALLALILVTTVKVQTAPRRSSQAGAGSQRDQIDLPRPKPPQV